VILSLSSDADLKPGELVYIAWYQRTTPPRGAGTASSAAANQ